MILSVHFWDGTHREINCRMATVYPHPDSYGIAPALCIHFNEAASEQLDLKLIESITIREK